MDKIIQIDALRIERGITKKCTCKNRKFAVDTVNREIKCECGIVIDPFEAMSYMATHYERINKQHVSLHEQSKKWIKQKPYSVLFKRLEQDYKKGKMLPYCPKCDQLFDFKDCTAFGNAEFYRKLEQKKSERLLEGEEE